MKTVTLDRRDASRAARLLVAADCAGAATGPGCAASADLLTSEIVTNAVVHGAGDIVFGVEVDARCCRVEVADDDPGGPRVGGADDAAESGRGLLIVEALASAWGVIARPVGKTVWFEVPAHP